jgi:hypothetical protein
VTEAYTHFGFGFATQVIEQIRQSFSPEPFGPEMVVKPSNSGTNVCFPNDLKLSSSISLIRKDTPK